MTTPTTPPAATPPATPPAEDPNHSLVKKLVKEALSEWQADQVKTRTQQEEDRPKNIIEKLFS